MSTRRSGRGWKPSVEALRMIAEANEVSILVIGSYIYDYISQEMTLEALDTCQSDSDSVSETKADSASPESSNDDISDDIVLIITSLTINFISASCRNYLKSGQEEDPRNNK